MVDGGQSTGKFADATGTGKLALEVSGNLPKASGGTCDESQTPHLSPRTAVATITGTVHLPAKK
jgi:hypothetical protein